MTSTSYLTAFCTWIAVPSLVSRALIGKGESGKFCGAHLLITNLSRSECQNKSHRGSTPDSPFSATQDYPIPESPTADKAWCVLHIVWFCITSRPPFFGTLIFFTCVCMWYGHDFHDSVQQNIHKWRGSLSVNNLRTLLTFWLNAPVVIRVKVIFTLEQSVETLAKCISELKLVTDNLPLHLCRRQQRKNMASLVPSLSLLQWGEPGDEARTCMATVF